MIDGCYRNCRNSNPALFLMNERTMYDTAHENLLHPRLSCQSRTACRRYYDRYLLLEHSNTHTDTSLSGSILQQ
jgi:hypothetical protein